MSHDKEWVCAPSADCDIWKSTEYFETKEAAIEAGKKVISQWNQGNTDTEIEDILGDWFKEDVKIVSFAVGQCFCPSLDIDAGYILGGLPQVCMINAEKSLKTIWMMFWKNIKMN
jgi:hypothetical protein